MTADEVAQVVDRLRPPSGTETIQWVRKAQQESSFRVDCVNELGCVGLWQVCPTNFGWLGVTKEALRASATLQFTAVKRIYERQGWDAWKASGGRPDFFSGQRPITDLPEAIGEGLADAPNPLDAIGALVAPLAALAGAVKGFGEWVTDPNTWRRSALAVGGLGLVLVGGVAIARGTEIGKAAENVATTVVPAGRAAKAAGTVKKAQGAMRAGAAKTRPKG